MRTTNRPLVAAGSPTRPRAAKDQTTVFPQQHPVLSMATGWAHHPYEMTFGPGTLPPTRAYFTTANLDDLSGPLRFAWLRYGQEVPRGGVPLY